MPFSYPARSADSNFEPIAIEIRLEGVLLPKLGAVVKVNVKDRDTADIIVTDGVAVPDSTPVENGIWRYWFTSDQVALITTVSVWLVEWSVQVGNYYWRLPEPAVMPVRKRL